MTVILFSCSILFIQKETSINTIPWLYDIKYKDLKLPININGNEIIGFEKIYAGEKIYIDSEFYYFIQSNSSKEKKNAITITYTDGIFHSFDLEYDKDNYRSLFCRSIQGDTIVYKYNKMPLVSNSMKYPGSISKTEARIYQHIYSGKDFILIFKMKAPL